MNKAVIFANGQSPFFEDFSLEKDKYNKFLQNLKKDVSQSDIVIACDGAIKYIEEENSFIPDYIVGDLDSIDFRNLNLDIQKKYLAKLIRISDQDTNDLTKAVNFAISKNVKQIVIYGATGKREDHSLANIALLLEYACQLDSVVMKSQYGTFYPVKKSLTCKTAPNCQISIFSIDKNVRITSKNLAWELHNTKLPALWMGSLNRTLKNRFTIQTNSSKAYVLVWLELKANLF
ncbi:MAG: thiamine diphosphokinase [Bifidobacteriaceae bacterium]|jgi:thiamine pyrophosphokinase|nr:thiamine diphosphokinase [Bifidobacteriaceae bacterium]